MFFCSLLIYCLIYCLSFVPHNEISLSTSKVGGGFPLLSIAFRWWWGKLRDRFLIILLSNICKMHKDFCHQRLNPLVNSDCVLSQVLPLVLAVSLIYKRFHGFSLTPLPEIMLSIISYLFHMCSYLEMTVLFRSSKTHPGLIINMVAFTHIT